MTRRAKLALAVVAIVALQALAWLGYRAIERDRAAPRGFVATPIAASPAPALVVERDGEAPYDLTAARGRVRLVHFWATWCVPCRAELPALVAAAAEVGDLELIAVSVDDRWDVIRGFFPRGVPTTIVRALDRDAHRRFGGQALPDAYVVSADGQLIERIAGARDWTRPDARAYLRGLAARVRDHRR